MSQFIVEKYEKEYFGEAKESYSKLLLHTIRGGCMSQSKNKKENSDTLAGALTIVYRKYFGWQFGRLKKAEAKKRKTRGEEKLEKSFDKNVDVKVQKIFKK